MKYYRFPDNRFVKICFPLLLLALQMVARSTMYASTFLGFALSQAIMIGLVCFVGVAFLIYNRRNLKPILTDRRMVFLLGSAVVVLAPMVIKQDWQMMYFSILLCWFFAVFLTYFTTTRELGRWYVRLMTALALFALAGQFLLKPMVHAGLLPGNPFDSPGGWHMYNFVLTFPCNTNNGNVDAMRTFGIFREPGLFQIFLFVAIALNDHVVQWDRDWKLWAVDAVLFLTLLTTFATGGVLALGLYILFLFFDRGLYRIRKMQILMAALILGFAAFVVYSLRQGGTWAYELYGMVWKIFARTDSLTTRTESIVADARMFLGSPLWGANISEVMYAVSNNTCSSPIIFAVFGIVGGCVHVASWVALAWKKERPVLMNLLLLVILFVPFNTQNVIHDMFFWMFPIMALTEKCLPRLPDLKWKKRVE